MFNTPSKLNECILTLTHKIVSKYDKMVNLRSVVCVYNVKGYDRFHQPMAEH